MAMTARGGGRSSGPSPRMVGMASCKHGSMGSTPEGNLYLPIGGNVLVPVPSRGPSTFMNRSQIRDTYRFHNHAILVATGRRAGLNTICWAGHLASGHS